MLKRNFTSELVKKFHEALDNILEYKNSNKYSEALTLIDDTFKEIFRLSSKFFNSFSDENLIDIIKTDGTVNTDKCIMMAKLLEEESDIFKKQGNINDAFYTNLKSLNLFLEAYINKNNSCDLENYFSDIDCILDELSEYKISAVLQNKIIHYYTKKGSYDKAENILYELLENNNFSKASIDLGISFYEELILKEDKDLEKGNLPREEINESLFTLKQKLNENTN